MTPRELAAKCKDKLGGFDPECPCEKCADTRRYLHEKHLGPIADPKPLTPPRELAASARALADAATRGPWQWRKAGGFGIPRERDDPAQLAADYTFVAASRTLVPQLADALERACVILETCRAIIDNVEQAPNTAAAIRAFLAGEVKQAKCTNCNGGGVILAWTGGAVPEPSHDEKCSSCDGSGVAGEVTKP